ncbi:AbrB/MazE/SpoVT family DNA-binding domain-containing protein [Paenibacillus xylanexedens]|uniref:AbrB/MazE/SpoVT family DNA-binding domain-containing protein n=1 Tax=Paenibacillus xylanexedens TaxID=528191 RepID=UPI001F0016A6|nr:AbrB/MazE/SpoVT family DNA-binding domain-containing protein [Paenibacillus xylanexedens]
MNGGAQMKEEHSKRKILSRKIGKMGNSLSISLPKVLIDKLHVSQGDEIEFIENSQGEIVLKKVKQMKIPENVRPRSTGSFLRRFRRR